MKHYTATKSRNQGRESWAVIFRHPARHDLATGKPGRRVRRGLGTSDETAADRLVTQLNELLRSDELWEPSSRTAAAARFDPLVVDIFYDGLEPTRIDYPALRETHLPLPTADDGYRKLLLLGTTGAGKTTVVRQLLGTDPVDERFPSTSTAKTTVADTELIATSDDLFRAAVTFAPRDEVIDYLTENVSTAALAAFRGRPDDEITRKLLDHVNQRFRFSYVLGRGAALDGDSVDDLADDDIDDASSDESGIDLGDYSVIDLAVTAQVIANAVSAVKAVVTRHSKDVAREFRDIGDDERVLAELIEENLDSDLRGSDEFHQIVDSLVDEIEKRFATLTIGELKRNRQGWPTLWHWESTDRTAFMKTISRFSSNYAPLFGRLLTPLVNGIRVAGPFSPTWADEPLRFVLIDGEGLGHTPKSVANLSTHASALLEQADSVVLVDNAAQPMQAAPVAALKSIAVSGNTQKLHFLFTHFDQVGGDNLPTFSAREEHVLASAENVLKSVGDELGPTAERALRKRIDHARFFVGGIHEELDRRKRSSKRTIDELTRLTTLLAHPELLAPKGPSVPVFDRMNLSLAVTEAAKAFHSRWRALLGIETSPDVQKEHWTRVKALSRRLAEGWTDEYDNLQPVANLLFHLQSQVYLMFQKPVRWEGGEPSDDDKLAIIEELSNAVTKGLMDLTRQRIVDDVRRSWQEAYAQQGQGSTYVRARIIASDVYERGAPIPTVSASPDQNRFLKDVAALVADVSTKVGAVLE